MPGQAANGPARGPNGKANRKGQGSQVIGRETLPRPLRFAIMAVAMLSLLLAMWAGLVRVGWRWPTLFDTLPPGHGPLMVCGFLGTMIGLERAVGLGRRWAFAAPILSAGGAIALIFGAPTDLAALLITVGSLILVIVLAQLLRIQVALYLVALVVGVFCWFVGNVLWLLGWLVPVAALWWMGFLVITISGERLELSRMLRLSTRSQGVYAATAILMIAAMALGIFDFALGMRVMGMALLGMAGWLLFFDIAWRRLHAGGQARYTAVCLLAGYVWLCVAGVIAVVRGGAMAGPVYDAILHAVFLGFVFSMVFGHAPIIFPAVLQLPVRYVAAMYAPLVALHLSLALRVGGDLLLWYDARLWGSLLGALSILLYLGILLTSALTQPRDVRRAGGQPV